MKEQNWQNQLRKRLRFCWGTVFSFGIVGFIVMYFCMIELAGGIDSLIENGAAFPFVEGWFYIPFIAYFVGYAVVIFIFSGTIRRTREEIQHTFLADSCYEIFEKIDFSPEKGLNKDVLESSSLIRMGKHYYSNDLIKAKYKGIPFEISNVSMKEEHKNNVMIEDIVMIFQGQWFVFKLDHNPIEYLQVSDVEFMGSIMVPNRWKKIELENSMFNQLFHVHSSDKKEVEKILTAPAMEKVLEIKSQLGGELLLGIMRNELHLAINSKRNLFEFQEWIKKGVPYQNELISRLRLLVSIIDELDLAK